MRITFNLFDSEDPDLVAELSRLGRYERARRIRGLLRTGLDAERGLGAKQPSPDRSPYPALAPAVPVIPDFDPRQFNFRKDSVL